MASLHRIDIGELTELWRVLAAAGWDPRHVLDITQSPLLAEELRGLIDQRTSPYFNPPDNLLQALRERAAERNWPLKREQFEQLAETRLRYPKGRLSTLTFDIWLGSFKETIYELLFWFYEVHAERLPERPELVMADYPLQRLRLYNSTGRTAKPSVFWNQIHLDVGWHASKQNPFKPGEMRDPFNSAGLQVLVTGALHPKWASAMDSHVVPYAFLGGLEWKIPGQREHGHLPQLTWGIHGSGPAFRPYDMARDSYNTAMPTVELII